MTDRNKYWVGEWTAHKAYGDWNVYDGDEALVASIHADDHQARVAKLIAASPDMLLVLRLRDELRADGWLPDDSDPRMKAWSAALAKAGL